VVSPATGKNFGGSLGEIPGLGEMGYIAMTAFALNLVVTVLVTLGMRAAKVSNGRDRTRPGDYFADAGDPRVDADLAVEDDLTRGEPDPTDGQPGSGRPSSPRPTTQ